MTEEMRERYGVYAKLLEHPLSRDDTFRFKCLACGKCCKHREDILLSPYDLFRIAKYLGIEVVKVIQEYCVYFIGTSSKLPVIVLNMQGAERKCPFLEKGKCRIHSAKPSVCGMYPLGRIGTNEDYSFKYILQDVRCGTRDEEHTVREWLGEFGLEESEKWFEEWQKVIMPLSERMNGYSNVPDGVMSEVNSGILNLLYVQYDTKQDLLEQFHENVRKMNVFLELIESILKGFAFGRELGSK